MHEGHQLQGFTTLQRNRLWSGGNFGKARQFAVGQFCAPTPPTAFRYNPD